ncbi:cation:proton antiporter domain-containing protein [Phycicoccus sonneratiae]|uniref:Cation:proton antiporter n=1 Tax=Phycicoccus sonneratiae TaxID=2807628 RepID=A0ABS2CMC3_9MICO|nr:cation:proton antiporter [Phycicoccus sonneraticus]MBM6401022.1 cation:proton antiporter [Phycicoccus sonneraticus]
MQPAALVVALVLVVIVVSRLAAPRGVPVPIALLGVGAVLSVIPQVPEVRLSPDVVLYGLLPPLLYSAALSSSLVDIRTYRSKILSLSVGLVLFTAVGVALVVSALMDVDFALALALGAIVAPPDAVAATAVARRIGLPRKITTILEGESLLNDATALVTLRTALAAAGLAAHGAGAPAAGISLGSVGLDLLVAAVGGVAVGVVAYLVVGWLRRRLTEVPADTALSFIAPFVAYAPAEVVGASGVLAVVTAGLLLAYRAPVLQSAPSRLAERINWSSVTFVLENAVFLLIGLQVWSLVGDTRDGELGTGRTLAVAGAVLLTVLVLRPVWLVAQSALQVLRGKADRRAMLGWSLVSGWAGMRGVVTLAAALTLPEDTPMRPELVLIALVVTVGTLVLQGTTLPALARWLDVRGPDPREDALQEATVLGATTGAGLRALEDDPDADPDVVRVIRQQADDRVNRSWERLGTLGPGDRESPAEARARLRVEMIHHEREELLRIRAAGQVDHAVLTSVLGQLDAEETALAWSATRTAGVRESELRPPERVAGACDHLADDGAPHPPSETDGCPECRAEGLTWVHLRSCTTCGHVGCCDSSVGKHATAHFHGSGHPVMRSIEPGEAWRWCFVDEVLG